MAKMTMEEMIEHGVFADRLEFGSSTLLGTVVTHERNVYVWVIPQKSAKFPRFQVFDAEDSNRFAASIRLDDASYDPYGIFNDKLDEDEKFTVQEFMDGNRWSSVIKVKNNWEATLFWWGSQFRIHEEDKKYAIDENNFIQPNYLELPD